MSNTDGSSIDRHPLPSPPPSSAAGLAQSRHRPEQAPASLQGKFFEPAKLAGLEKMRFTTSRRVDGVYSGRHVAKQRGGAGEFVDYREYAPGDDLRHLDWKAKGRTGRSYLKRFQDETDLHCTLLIDASGSMLQGARSASQTEGSKLQWIQYFSTAMSHLISQARDCVGLAVARQSLDAYLPPQSSQRQLALMHQQIEHLIAEGETELGKSLDDLWVLSRRRGVLMLVSDFLVEDLTPVIASLRKFRVRGWEIVVLHVVHPDEQVLPDGNAFRFVGLENDGDARCQIAEIRDAYQKRFAAHVDEVRGMLVSVGCDYHFVSTNVPYVDVLRRFMAARSSQ